MTRQRQKILRSVGHGEMSVSGGPFVKLPSFDRIMNESLVSQNHPSWPKASGKADVGGVFFHANEWYSSEENLVEAQGLGRVYRGTIHTQAPAVGSTSSYFGELAFPQPGDYDSLVPAGATAISRTIPTNPVAGAAVFLGETREGLPRILGEQLLKTRLRDLRKAGGEYLNVEFGWKPLVSDLRKFASSVKSSNKVITQMHRDSGVNTSIRRGYRFPTTTSGGEYVTWQGGARPYTCDGGQLDSWMLGSGAQPIGTTGAAPKITTKRWFSGAYSYVLPPPSNNLLGKLERYDSEANKLLGTRLTPEVLWNLAPWSWAADWFANTGDVIHNFAAFGSDSLALKWGYLMQETTEERLTIWQGYINSPSVPNRYVILSETYGKTTKVRIRATPFGFGLNFDGFTPKQLAISSALGASRAPRISL